MCVASELEYFLDAYAGATPRLLVDPMGVFALKGIPGQTALVQLSLDERTAGFGSRKFVESKKAQRISPGDKFARVVIEAMEATEIGASATVDVFDAGSPKAKPGGSSGWKTLRGAVGKKRIGAWCGEQRSCAAARARYSSTYRGSRASFCFRLAPLARHDGRTAASPFSTLIPSARWNPIDQHRLQNIGCITLIAQHRLYNIDCIT